jgi:hypothetical protein
MGRQDVSIYGNVLILFSGNSGIPEFHFYF